MNIETHEDLTGFAPTSERWTAIDADTYDGAPDAKRPSTFMGVGATPEAAIADLETLFADYAAEQENDQVIAIVHLNSGLWAWNVEYLHHPKCDRRGNTRTLAGALDAVAAAVGLAREEPF
jgi:hypothetical protein